MNFPTLPMIGEAELVRSAPRPYDGPIEPGDVFAWEPDLPHARELIVVVRVGPPPPPIRIGHALGTAVISSGSEDVVYMRPLIGNDQRPMYNDVSRFREAVVPTIYKKQEP